MCDSGIRTFDPVLRSVPRHELPAHRVSRPFHGHHLVADLRGVASRAGGGAAPRTRMQDHRRPGRPPPPLPARPQPPRPKALRRQGLLLRRRGEIHVPGVYSANTGQSIGLPIALPGPGELEGGGGRPRAASPDPGRAVGNLIDCPVNSEAPVLVESPTGNSLALSFSLSTVLTDTQGMFGSKPP